MNTEPEPLAAVLAYFRKFALRAAEEGRTISPESVLLLADKVEAAAQERVSLQGTIDKMRRAISENTPGNAAAMRAALEKAHDNIKKAREFIAWQTREDELLMEAQQEIKTALAAPARNCDRFATELDARLAWKRETHCKGDYRYWLFDPAEGGAE